jgi:hypothetical protein
MFSLTRFAKVGYLLTLSVVVALLIRPSLSHGQFRGNLMPPRC